MSGLDFKCEYCNSLQSTKGHLDRHKKTSKTCIKLQEAKGCNCCIYSLYKLLQSKK
jgi:hypothetical protein